MQYANVRGIRDFGDGRYLVDPAWRSRLRVPGAAQARLVHRHAHSILRRSPRSRRRLSGHLDLRRSLRDPRGARRQLFQALVDRDARPGAGRQRRDENLRPWHDGSALDRRVAAAVGAREHRGVRRRSRCVRHQLAGRSHVQLLSRSDRRLRHDHRGLHEGRTDERCFRETPRGCFASDSEVARNQCRQFTLRPFIISASALAPSTRRCDSGSRFSDARRVGERF